MNVIVNNKKHSPSFIIGQKIKSIRCMRKLSGKELGDKIYMSQQNVSRIENGQVRIDVDLIRRISSALDVELYEIINNIGYERSACGISYYCKTYYQANSLV